MWLRMINLTDDFIEGRCDLRRLSGSLEGLLDTSEIKDQRLVKMFYDYWQPFEIECACSAEMGTAIDLERMRDQAREMKEFLNSTLQAVREYDPGDY